VNRILQNKKVNIKVYHLSKRDAYDMLNKVVSLTYCI